jgi:hypothetical protein
MSALPLTDFYVEPPDVPIGMTIADYRLRRPYRSRRWRLRRRATRHQGGE